MTDPITELTALSIAIADAKKEAADAVATAFTELQVKVAEATLRVQETPPDPPDPPPPPPDPPAPSGLILSGPMFTGDGLTEESFHQAFGVRKTNTMHGIENVRIVDTDTYAIFAPGRGDVSAEKVDTWIEIEPVTAIESSFTVEFEDLDGNPTDLGRQAKFGWGLSGYHSGKAWPGGNNLFPPDWLIRPTWNLYTGGEPKFGVYIYTPTDNPGAHVGWDGDRGSRAWGGRVRNGSGFRRAVRVDPKHGPVPGGRHDIKLRVEGADNASDAELTFTVDGTSWVFPLGRIGSCDRVVPTSRWGGGDGDGPTRDTEYQISNVVVAER